MAVAVTASSVLVAGGTASAVTSVTTASGATWQIHDSARPGLDTGSIRALSESRIDGYGNIFVRVATDQPERMNDQMVRGFGLEAQGSAFTTTQAVELAGVAMTREIDVSTTSDIVRYLDTFTNTTGKPQTVEVSFGGALGYGWDEQQGTIRATSSGDTVIGNDDAWTIAAQPVDDRRPVGTVLGSPAPFAGAMTKTGNQERNPFETPLATSGQESNFYGYINKLTIEPNETQSLLRFVAAGEPVAGATEVLATSLDALAVAPDIEGLAIDAVCSIANWNLDRTGCADSVRLDIPAVPLAPPKTTTVEYDVVNKTIEQLQTDMVSGLTTSEEITQAYLDRIAAYDDGQFGFNAFITVADNALEQARDADAARAAGTVGDLLGVPIALKDLYNTADMPTTGGTRALEGWQAQADAFQVARLREAGAVIIGKTNMSEFANSGNYSESGYGQVWNGLFPSKTSFGSSGGSAVAIATSMAAATMGSQTGNSLWGPTAGASTTMFRGTDGMASLSGVMPLEWLWDYAGPMTRSVTDLSYILNAVTGTDPADVLTAEADAHRPANWTDALDPASLSGARVGYLPTSFVSKFTDDGTGASIMSHFADLEAAGATVVEMTPPPAAPASPLTDSWSQLVAEGWSRYIDSQPNFPFDNVNDLYNDPKVLPYNQNEAAYPGALTEQEVTAALEHRNHYKQMISDWMDVNDVDVIVFPGYISDFYNNDGNSVQHSADRNTGILTSDVGLPTVMVPVGANPHGYPISMQLVGRAWSDQKVLGMAYALEQQADGQQFTQFAPALPVASDSSPVGTGSMSFGSS